MLVKKSMYEAYSCTYAFDKQKQSSEVFCKKAVLKDFTIFSGKHLCFNFFLIKFQTSVIPELSNIDKVVERRVRQSR